MVLRDAAAVGGDVSYIRDTLIAETDRQPLCERGAMDPQTEQYLLTSIKRFFLEELEIEIGDLKARTVLDFIAREIGPSVYNQAIADAQVFFERATSDLAGVRYQPEFDYWGKREI